MEYRASDQPGAELFKCFRDESRFGQVGHFQSGVYERDLCRYKLDEFKFRFVVQQSGPTSFVLKNEAGKKFKTVLGSSLACSCGSSKGHPKEHCIHTLFLVLKVFQVPTTNPVTWQVSYLDTEIQDIVSYRQKIKDEKIVKEIREKKRRSRRSSNTTDEEGKHKERTAPYGYDDDKGLRKVTSYKLSISKF